MAPLHWHSGACTDFSVLQHLDQQLAGSNFPCELAAFFAFLELAALLLCRSLRHW